MGRVKKPELMPDNPVVGKYWVLKRHWNRNIIYGPHTRLRAAEMAVEEFLNDPAGRGGPVEFIQMSANLGKYRVVNAKGGGKELQKFNAFLKVWAKDERQ